MKPDRDVRQEVLSVQERFWQALRAKDADALTSVIAPDFVGRSPGEADQTRDAFIATLSGFPVQIGEITGEAIEVHVFGEIAILTGVQLARLSLPDGSAKLSRVTLTNVFRHEDQAWRMVLSHAFEVTQPL